MCAGSAPSGGHGDWVRGLQKGRGMENGLAASSPITGPESPQSPAKTPQTSVAGVHADLISRALGGDMRAFEELLSEARPRAVAVATKVLHDPDDAEDAVQEAFLKAWKNLARFEGRSAFATWIHRIVMNSSLDLLRRRACRPTTLGVEDDSGERRTRPEPVTTETPERVLARSEAHRLVHGALAELSPTHRQTVTLREIEEHSYEEIAQISACPIGTVMSRLHHARKRLAEELQAAIEPDLTALAA
jgi:RNA polymerase sigma-70 factor, ECF subfamily